MTDTSVEKRTTKNSSAPDSEKTNGANACVVPDLASYAKLPQCELWVKSNIKFDHPTIDVKSYTLLFTGDPPRKFCFNTYNDALGKRNGPLPIQNFLSNEPIKDAKNPSPWYKVRDLDKARAKLQRDGYERM